MRDPITVYSIKLSEDNNRKDFGAFMRNEIFPEVYKGVTRLGQITGLVLLSGNTTSNVGEYLWLVYGAMDGGAARSHIDKIKAFGAQVSQMDDFVESIRWVAEDHFEPAS
jgi:hypothetical protein